MLSVVLLLTLPTEPLTMDRAVQIALAEHPDLAAARFATRASRAAARQTRGALLPQAALQGQYGWSSGQLAAGGTDGEKAFNATVAGDWLLWDFGQTWKRWQSSEALADSTISQSAAAAQQVVLAARLAFLDVLETEALSRVAEETLANQQRHLAQIAEFVRTGTRPEIDLAKLRTRVAEARAERIRAQNAHRVAKTYLNRAMGRRGPIEFEIAETELPPLIFEGRPIEELFAMAEKQRSELVALRYSVRAQEMSLEAASRHYWPSLRLAGDATYYGEGFRQGAWGTSAGLILRLPLFEGLIPSAVEASTEATLGVESANLAGQEQEVWQEIEAARLGVSSAKAQLDAAQEAVVSARALLRLAEERYQAGVGDSLELSDAQLEVANAAAGLVGVAFDLAGARARLLFAVGLRDWGSPGYPQR